MKLFARKRLWLLAIPLLVGGLGLARVQEARSWLPKTVALFPQSSAIEQFFVPMQWRENGVWLLRRNDWPSINPEFGKGKKLKNWNRSIVSIHAPVKDPNEVAIISADGTQTLRASNEKIGLWKNGKFVRSVVEKPVSNRYNLQEPAVVLVMSVAPDGTRWAADSSLAGLHDIEEMEKGFSEYGAVLWDGKSGRQIARYNAQGGSISALAFSPDSRTLAGITVTGHAYLWEAQTGRKLRRWRAHPFAGATLAWSPNSQTLLTGANPRLRERVDGRMIKTYGGSFSLGIGGKVGKDVTATNVQGDWTINGQTDRSLRLWNVKSGQMLRKWESPTGVCSAQFSPDGRELAVGTHGQALILNAANLNVARRLPMKDFPTWPASVAWSPDGATLAVACAPQLSFWRAH